MSARKIIDKIYCLQTFRIEDTIVVDFDDCLKTDNLLFIVSEIMRLDLLGSIVEASLSFVGSHTLHYYSTAALLHIQTPRIRIDWAVTLAQRIL